MKKRAAAPGDVAREFSAMDHLNKQLGPRRTSPMTPAWLDAYQQASRYGPAVLAKIQQEQQRAKAQATLEQNRGKRWELPERAKLKAWREEMVISFHKGGNPVAVIREQLRKLGDRIAEKTVKAIIRRFKASRSPSGS